MKLESVLEGCEYELVTSNRLQVTSGEENADSPLVTCLPDSRARHSSLPFDIEISGIAYDSRKVVGGTAFVAIEGEHFDGRDFIGDAVKRGAAAIVYEKSVQDFGFEPRDPSPVFIQVNDGRRALACMADNFFGRPSVKLSVIGVTGTNGKTTTSHIIKSILEAWRKEVGMTGTIGYYIGDKEYPARHTTPEAPEFQSLLSEMYSSGCGYVVSEVSSHALVQKRVDRTRFVVVVFTNLTREHLDYHGTMEGYYKAKRMLFTDLLSRAGTAVVNVDDEWGRRLLRELRETGKSELITYGIETEADVSEAGTPGLFRDGNLTVRYGGESYRFSSCLPGTPNVYNILAAVSAGIALKIPMEVIKRGVKDVRTVKGRFETVDAGQDFLCIVDYAHTPDALERLIQTARELIKKSKIKSRESNAKENPELRNLSDSSLVTHHSSPRIITVFGCGGDRDKGKRPVMGEIAARLSDLAIITSDNPRSEGPEAIIDGIVSGISEGEYIAIPDRAEAIKAAVEKASPGDVLIIAGKGHEDYQEIKGVKYRFSDKEIAEEAIKKRYCGISRTP